MADDWTPLHGGNVNTVSRRGEVVKRQLSASSPAVHQLLGCLEARAVPLVPRLLGTSEREEFLTFLPGRAVFRPWPHEVKREHWLVELGSWLRTYHEAVRGFELANVASDSTFLWGPPSPTEGMIVCHGDLGPWNCLHEDGRLTGVIDWDLARYGNPLDDVAELALEAVPLHPRLAETLGAGTTQRTLERRLEVFCGAYRVPAKVVLQHAPNYLQMVIDDTQALAALEVEPFASFAKGGIPEALAFDRNHVLTHWL